MFHGGLGQLRQHYQAGQENQLGSLGLMLNIIVLRLVLLRSKTDQEGETKTLGLPYGSNPATCPVRAWRAWQTASGIDGGAAFRGITRHGRISARCLSDKAEPTW